MAAKRDYHCIVAETTERHYVVEAVSKHDAAFKLAMAISADPATIEPQRIGTTKVATHISPVLGEDDEK